MSSQVDVDNNDDDVDDDNNDDGNVDDVDDDHARHLVHDVQLEMSSRPLFQLDLST